jgi:membrane-associated HD superfamily phosphohydrolase
MEIKFRNRPLILNKHNTDKIQETINIITKQQEEKLKQQFNKIQTQHIIKEAIFNCQNECNNKIYETTLNSLIQQFENDCKPIIYQELKQSIHQESSKKIEEELKQSIHQDSSKKIEEELKQNIEKENRTIFENELKIKI